MKPKKSGIGAAAEQQASIFMKAEILRLLGSDMDDIRLTYIFVRKRHNNRKKKTI